MTRLRNAIYSAGMLTIGLALLAAAVLPWAAGVLALGMGLPAFLLELLP